LNNQNGIDIVDLSSGRLLKSISLPFNIDHIVLDKNYIYAIGRTNNSNNVTLNKIELLTNKIVYSQPIGKNEIVNLVMNGDNIILAEKSKNSQTTNYFLLDKNNGDILTKRQLLQVRDINGLNSIKIPKIENDYIWSTIEFDKYIYDAAQGNNVFITDFPTFKIYYENKKTGDSLTHYKEIEVIDYSRRSEGIFDFKHPKNINQFILQTDIYNPQQFFIDERITFSIKKNGKTLIKFKPIISSYPKEIPVEKIDIRIKD